MLRYRVECLVHAEWPSGQEALRSLHYHQSQHPPLVCSGFAMTVHLSFSASVVVPHLRRSEIIRHYGYGSNVEQRFASLSDLS